MLIFKKGRFSHYILSLVTLVCIWALVKAMISDVNFQERQLILLYSPIGSTGQCISKYINENVWGLSQNFNALTSKLYWQMKSTFYNCFAISAFFFQKCFSGSSIHILLNYQQKQTTSSCVSEWNFHKQETPFSTINFVFQQNPLYEVFFIFILFFPTLIFCSCLFLPSSFSHVVLLLIIFLLF